MSQSVEQPQTDSDPIVVEVEEAALPAGSIGFAEPRIRWAGIIWGVALAAIATMGIWFSLENGGATSLTPWVMSLTPFTITIGVVLTLAVLAVIATLTLVARFAQKSLLARRART